MKPPETSIFLIKSYETSIQNKKYLDEKNEKKNKTKTNLNVLITNICQTVWIFFIPLKQNFPSLALS